MLLSPKYLGWLGEVTYLGLSPKKHPTVAKIQTILFYFLNVTTGSNGGLDPIFLQVISLSTFSFVHLCKYLHQLNRYDISNIDEY